MSESTVTGLSRARVPGRRPARERRQALRRRDAVDGISLEIPHGSFFALLGPSGCGKTTTLRMIGGFEEPTAGAIFLGDRDVVGLPPYKRDVNTVFQSYALFPHMTIFDNVAFGLERRGVREGRDPGARARDARARRPRRARGPQAEAALRRPAAARRARPRARQQPARAAARRAARRARPEAAQADAARAEAHPARGRDHVRPRHARPGGGDDDGRHDRRHEPAAASSSSARPTELYERPADGVRGRLPRQVEPARRASSRAPGRSGSATARSSVRTPAGRPAQVAIGVRPEKVSLGDGRREPPRRARCARAPTSASPPRSSSPRRRATSPSSTRTPRPAGFVPARRIAGHRHLGCGVDVRRRPPERGGSANDHRPQPPAAAPARRRRRHAPVASRAARRLRRRRWRRRRLGRGQGRAQLLELAAVHRLSTRRRRSTRRSTQFTAKTGIKVDYFEDINSNAEYFGKIQGPLSQGQSIDRDIIVLTDNERFLGLMIDKGWVEELDKDKIPNISNLIDAQASPPFDPDRKYSLPWQSGMTGIAWNEDITGPVTSITQLFEDPKLKGKITALNGMGDTMGLVMLDNGDDPADGHRRHVEQGARTRAGRGRLGPDPPVHRQRLRAAAGQGRSRRRGRVVGRHLSSCSPSNPKLKWALPTKGGMHLDRQHDHPARAAARRRRRPT